MRHHSIWREQTSIRRNRSFSFRTFFRNVREIAHRSDFGTMSAAIAFHTAFAIPPLISLVVLGAALANRIIDFNVADRLYRLIRESAPDATQPLLNSLVETAIVKVDGTALSAGIMVSVVVSFWSVSRAISAMIISFNRAYGVEDDRSYFVKRGLTLGLSLALVLVINLSFGLLIFGHRIGSWFAKQLGTGDTFDLVWSYTRWVVGVVMIVAFLGALYRVGPNVNVPYQWLSPGSLVASLMLVVSTAGFATYLQFVDPGSAYGAVGSLVILLIYLQLMAFIFILGAAINAIVMELQRAPSESLA